MSEVTNTSRTNLRRHFLMSVSALAILGPICDARQAKADDSDRPTVWIELGGQFEQIESGRNDFAPPFLLATPRPPEETISPLSIEQPARYAIGGEAKVSFEPDNSDWVISASVKYGRSNGDKHVHQQTYNVPNQTLAYGTVAPVVYVDSQKFVDTQTKSHESSAILDFQAGKDVGLGLFGSGSSLLSLGVRFAQFINSTEAALASDPDFHVTYKYRGSVLKIVHGEIYHINTARLDVNRSFHGVGPSISWSATTPFLGKQGSGVSLDWGVNVAVLFGRQKAMVHHQTTQQYHSYGILRANGRQTIYQHSGGHTGSRFVVSPNVGGFAGFSYRYSNAKVSFGYRADLFFAAMDGGIDAAKKENVGFYGPFASISVGL